MDRLLQEAGRHAAGTGQRPGVRRDRRDRPGPQVRCPDEGLALPPQDDGRDSGRDRPSDRRRAGRPHPGRHAGQVARLSLHRHEQARWPTSSRAKNTGSCRSTSRSSSSRPTAPSAARSRPVKDKKGVWSIGRVPPDLRKLPEHIERRCGKIGTAYPQITFDKEQVVGYSDLEFVGPGHPLFEGVVERVLDRVRRLAAPGGVLLQRRRHGADRPLAAQVRRRGWPRPGGRRTALRHPPDSADRFRKSQPYALLDLKPPDGSPEVVAADPRRRPPTRIGSSTGRSTR